MSALQAHKGITFLYAKQFYVIGELWALADVTARIAIFGGAQ